MRTAKTLSLVIVAALLALLAPLPSAMAGTGDDLFTMLRTNPTDGVFYPRVHDGYRDKITFNWRVSEDAETRWFITNDGGGFVVGSDFSLDETGWVIWTRWNGENASGNVVRTGTYYFNLEDDTGAHATSIRFKVKSGWQTKRFTLYKDGTQTSDRDKRGSCYFRGDSDRNLTLDCWGGVYATAEYQFSVPNDAFDIDRRIVHGRGGCCSQGSVDSGWRGDRAFVTATGWRNQIIYYAQIKYSKRVRV